MAADDRYELEEPLMPPALAARSSFDDSVANLHPVGNTANLPKWLVKQYTRSMGRRGRGQTTTSLEHTPMDQTTATGQLSMDTRSKTRTLSPMSKANAKEAKVPTFIRWY